LLVVGKYCRNNRKNEGKNEIGTSRLDHNDDIFRKYFAPFVSAKGFDKIIIMIQ
jgi:hypothetical protein